MSLALPPVGWHRTVEQPAQMTTVWACEKTVVIVKQPGHLTSMKNDRGPGTRVCGGDSLLGFFEWRYERGDCQRTLSLCLRASAWGVGLRRSTARTCEDGSQLPEDVEMLRRMGGRARVMRSGRGFFESQLALAPRRIELTILAV